MKRVFPLPPAIIVPDGTELHEIVGPRILSEHFERVNDGVSVALGKLPAGIVSKIHYHPIVWHFTWVTKGTLTVRMKDESSSSFYELTVPEGNGVLTERGTFFQLINRDSDNCEVFYIVGPAFVFQQSDQGEVQYNDAVVLDYNWEELEQMNWQVPNQLPHVTIADKRKVSLRQLAGVNTRRLVNGESWKLKGQFGVVPVPSELHDRLVSLSNQTDVSKPLEPEARSVPSDAILEVVLDYVQFINGPLGIKTSEDFSKTDLVRILRAKCNQSPSVFAEYSLLSDLFRTANLLIEKELVWPLMLLGVHDDLTANSTLNRLRFHVLHELLDFCVTIGEGFKSFGKLDNYRGFMGGLYSDPNSYRQYKHIKGA